eukprot:snap_masked-scaffold_9-processed-gene-13.90-mRNA-1 protein AED:1.00 eAED:1.00 QI:0/0/0/0/1/1/6/0/204
MNSIKQQYEERDDKTFFKIEGEHDHNKNPVNPDKFKREIEKFVKGFQPNKEVSSISYSIFFYIYVGFDYCPFDDVRSIFVRFIICFPAVKALAFWNCRCSDENFQNFQPLKILKLNSLVFTECNIPEVSSFCSLSSSINTKFIRLCWNNFSAKYTNIIFKNLYFNKKILYIDIEEDVQNKAIVSAIKNYLKINKIIKSLICKEY